MFTDEKYFTVDGIFNRQNDRVYALSRAAADESGGVYTQVTRRLYEPRLAQS